MSGSFIPVPLASLQLNASNKVDKAGDTMTGPLLLNADPTAASQAATKSYVDAAAINSAALLKAGGTMTGPIVLAEDPTEPLHPATKEYTDAAVGGVAATAASATDMAAAAQTDAAIAIDNSTDAQAAASSAINAANSAVTIADGALPLTGGIMSGSLVLYSDPIIGLQPATKQYTDSAVSNLQETTEQSIAAVSAIVSAGVVGATVRGVWNSTSNSPALASSVGTQGDLWVVGTAGTTTLNGVSSWSIGDEVLFAAGTWHRVPLSSAFGTIAVQNANNVTITGGTAGLSELTVGTGLTASQDASSDNSLNFADEYGGIIFQIGSYGIKAGNASFVNATAATLAPTNLTVTTGGGATVLQANATTGILTIPGATTQDDGDDTVSFRILDNQGGILFQLNADSTLYVGNLIATSVNGGSGGGGTDDPTVYSADEIAARNASALGQSNLIGSDTLSARAVWGINTVFAYGQSLMVGFEGWPRLTMSQPFDNLMLGQSTRTTGFQGGSTAPTTWTPLTDSNFHPLTATVQDEPTGVIISDSAAALLSPGDATCGESADIGALNFWRRQQLNLRGLPSDATRRLLSVNCAVGGRSVAQLSKGASPALYNRLTSAATAVKTAATAASLTSGVAAMMYMQGEADYTLGTSVSAYKASMIQLRSDFTADVQVGIFGQTVSGNAGQAAMFTYQPGPGFITETVDIGEALLQLSEQQPGWYLAAPVYPVTDKNGHLDPNGYRWMGMQFGKVMHKVLDLGQTWIPLKPINITARNLQVLVDFHVPAPPIVFDNPYVATTAISYAGKGFWVSDSGGDVAITSVAIVSDTQVLLTVARPLLSGSAILSYGKLTPYNGNGNLRDSDTTLADTDYVYNPGTGQYSAANISALVGNPYPLYNWCVNFYRPITVE